ncbi:MAG: hypothetical protein MZV70_08305 [Desulfobacterales bacterium]|nr:hypothetical protein [Desulfobacterales bacterium]
MKHCEALGHRQPVQPHRSTSRPATKQDVARNPARHGVRRRLPPAQAGELLAGPRKPGLAPCRSATGCATSATIPTGRASFRHPIFRRLPLMIQAYRGGASRPAPPVAAGARPAQRLGKRLQTASTRNPVTSPSSATATEAIS